MAWNVVVAGGGFGGLYAARKLERALPRHSARITLITDENFLLYTPLLPGAASGTLEPRHVVVPLREELEWCELRLGRVTGADPAKNEIYFRTPDGRERTERYDQLIVGLGSESRLLPVPGLEEHALGFKTLPEAVSLRNRLLANLEIAESLDDPAERASYLSFVFVGAGYAGLEGIAELQDFAADVIDRYPRSRLDGMRWVLVEAQERVMPEVPPSLARFAEDELRGRGLEIRTSTRVDSLEADAITLSDGERIPSRMKVWTAGVKPIGVTSALNLPLSEHGRIVCDRTLRVEGHDNVWALGDGAAVPDPAAKGKPCPPTAQHALRQGRLAARNVAGALAGRKPKPFRYRTLGVFVDMGRHQAVATMLGVRLRGFPAWFAARTYHLVMMPGHARRIRLMVDWTVGLFFGRASAELGRLGSATSLGAAFEESDRA